MVGPASIGPGTLAGLSPEQIANVMQYEQGNRKLQQSTVQDIINAQNMQSEISAREAGTNLNIAHTDTARALLPQAAEAQSSEIGLRRANAIHALQQAASAESTDPVRKKLLEAELAKTIAMTPVELAARQAGIAHIQAQTSQLTTLLPLEKTALETRIAGATTANAQAELNLENEKALGNIPLELKKALLEKAQLENQSVEVKIPTEAHPEGVPMRLTSAQIQMSIAHHNTTEQQRQVHADAVARQNTEAQIHAQSTATKLVETASAAEEKIISNLNAPAVVGHADTFNATSDKHYIWTVNPPALWQKNNPFVPDLAQKVPIPKYYEGKTIVHPTARQVSQEASKLGLTPKEYIEAIGKSRKLVK